MGRGRERRAGACWRIRISLCALVIALSIGVTSAYADDVSEAYADDVSEEYADDASEEDADDASEDYTDDEAEDVDEDTGPGGGRKAWDAALLRPLNFIRLVAGCVLMAPISVLTLPAGIDNFQNMADYFVDQPYWDTFRRPLGKF